MQTIRYNIALKMALTERKMTQGELAHKIKLPEAYISRLITGKMNLEKPQLALIAIALNKELSDLFPD